MSRFDRRAENDSRKVQRMTCRQRDREPSPVPLAYGALGRAYGFDIPLLFAGSMYAAKFPQRGTFDYDNEMADRLFIVDGFYSGH